MRRSARQRTRSPYRRSDVLRARRNRRKPNYLLLSCIFAIVTTLSGSITFALSSPRLNVAKVDIKGTHLTDRDAVEEAASKTIGHNIILVRTTPTLRDVRGLCQVSRATMGRRFPNRLWLRVWEREPAAALESHGAFYLVESSGFVFHRLTTQPAGIPIVHVTGAEHLQPGRLVDSLSIKCALEVLRLARRDEIKLAKISVDPQGRICLNMGDDFRVFLGYPDEIARKMSKLRSALAHKPSMVRDGTYIDLSCPTAPAWRPKTAPPSAS